MRDLKISIFFVFFLYAGLASAQKPDATGTIAVDTSRTLLLSDSAAAPPRHRGAVVRFFTKNYPDPHKALLFSIIPGGGQIYNKKWWKLPIVYGAIGGMYWWLQDNLKQYRLLRDNYRLQVDGDPNTNPTEAPYDRIDAQSMKQYRDQFRRYTELTGLGFGLTYLLSVADAFVDAHLSRFDTSDDLGFNLKPSFQPAAGFGPTLGLSLVFRLDGKQHFRSAPPLQFGVGY